MRRQCGFTLIELSIVLVIIGLIVGGILVGQDLIKSAEVRAQVTQVEKFNQAVNTFRGKFNALPGDMGLSTANQFGFLIDGCLGDGTYPSGCRNGDGLIEGAGITGPEAAVMGENGLFWVDLSSPSAGALIQGQFPNSGAPVPPGGFSYGLTTAAGTGYIGDYLPTATLGYGNFVYVYPYNNYNWYGVSAITSDSSSTLYSSTTIPVIEGYKMDSKVDDGLPATGVVQALYVNGNQSYAGVQIPNAQTSDSTTSCYNTTSNAYSISSFANYGKGGNCAISFRFQ